MCGNYYQYHAPCGHGGIVSANSCRALGSTCFGPDPSKAMDITLPSINSHCSDCHAAAHQPNPDARLDENDPYRKEARERVAALEKEAREKKKIMKRKIADDAESTESPAKKVREDKKGSKGKKGNTKKMKGTNKAETEENNADRNDTKNDDGNDNGDDGYTSDIYNA
ncbi:hypothetical protein B0T13DRAFT_500327 [Neurospora crassa]|nr:hypothetical protein B0T13DRAFT_500327 [Neurospora crassa]